MRKISDEKIKQILANMTPDDTEDAAQLLKVGTELIQFMESKELRVDLWASILMAVHRGLFYNQLKKICLKSPETFEEYLIDYSVTSLKLHAEQ